MRAEAETSERFKEFQKRNTKSTKQENQSPLIGSRRRVFELRASIGSRRRYLSNEY